MSAKQTTIAGTTAPSPIPEECQRVGQALADAKAERRAINNRIAKLEGEFYSSMRHHKCEFVFVTDENGHKRKLWIEDDYAVKSKKLDEDAGDDDDDDEGGGGLPS